MTPSTPSAPSVPTSLTASGPRTSALGFGLLGLAAFGVALATTPVTAWSNLLLAAFALAGVGLAGPVFLALYHLTGARWGDGVLAVPQRLSALLPVAAVATLAVLLGAGALYPWADAARVHGDPILAHREGWMSVPFVLARTAVAFGLWAWLGARLVGRSRGAAAYPGEAARVSASRAGALFLVVFAPTFSLACFDLLLSLEPHWSSTMFALYHFAGLFESGLAVIVLVVLARRRAGALDVSPDVLHDLGKLLFAFAFLWGYLWFCQYLLVWYTNLPEEAAYYAARHRGAWEPLAVANVLLNWAFPFLLLLSRHMKRSPAALARAAALVLLGRWLDLYLHIQPTVSPDHALTIVPLVLALAMAAATAAAVRTLAAAPRPSAG